MRSLDGVFFGKRAFVVFTKTILRMVVAFDEKKFFSIVAQNICHKKWDAQILPSVEKKERGKSLNNNILAMKQARL